MPVLPGRARLVTVDSMTVQETELAGEAATQVVCWRFQQLRSVGFGLTDATIIASDTRVDLHAAADLVQRGCPTRLVLEILL